MKQKLLIIDDDSSIFTLLKQIFIKKYTVYTACDGVEALYYLSKRFIPDVIITDLNMNNVNGFELIRHLSTSHIFNKIPVIVLSYLGKNEAESLKAFPVVAEVVNKPFDPLVLSNIVSDALLHINPTEKFKNFTLNVNHISHPLN